jgi:hypothetical protein
VFEFLLMAGLGQAVMIQHLDATVASSVTTDGSGVVSQWADLSGAGNNAADLAIVGTIYYPSTSLSATGLAGADMGTGRNGFRLFNATRQDSWLDFTPTTGGASANSGFLRAHGQILKEQYLDSSVLIDAKLGRNQLPDLKRLHPERIEIVDA